MSADGPEQRTAEHEEHYAALDCDAELDAGYERDYQLSRIPTHCLVNGHTWFTNQFGLTFCQRCGNDEWDEPR